jgi:hypothetical protein
MAVRLAGDIYAGGRRAVRLTFFFNFDFQENERICAFR